MSVRRWLSFCIVIALVCANPLCPDAPTGAPPPTHGRVAVLIDATLGDWMNRVHGFLFGQSVCGLAMARGVAVHVDVWLLNLATGSCRVLSALPHLNGFSTTLSEQRHILSPADKRRSLCRVLEVARTCSNSYTSTQVPEDVLVSLLLQDSVGTCDLDAKIPGAHRVTVFWMSDYLHNEDVTPISQKTEFVFFGSAGDFEPKTQWVPEAAMVDALSATHGPITRALADRFRSLLPTPEPEEQDEEEKEDGAPMINTPPLFVSNTNTTPTHFYPSINARDEIVDKLVTNLSTATITDFTTTDATTTKSPKILKANPQFYFDFDDEPLRLEKQVERKFEMPSTTAISTSTTMSTSTAMSTSTTEISEKIASSSVWLIVALVLIVVVVILVVVLIWCCQRGRRGQYSVLKEEEKCKRDLEANGHDASSFRQEKPQSDTKAPEVHPSSEATNSKPTQNAFSPPPLSSLRAQASNAPSNRPLFQQPPESSEIPSIKAIHYDVLVPPDA